MPIADKIAAVEQAAAELQQTESDLERAREKFRAALIDARAAGASYALLGRTVGLSRQRIAQLVGDDA